MTSRRSSAMKIREARVLPPRAGSPRPPAGGGRILAQMTTGSATWPDRARLPDARPPGADPLGRRAAARRADQDPGLRAGQHALRARRAHARAASHEVGRLIAILHRLRDAGNTVVVVEHDQDVIRAADHVVDLGPGAGAAGGQVLYSGPLAGLSKVEGSATGDYLTGANGSRCRETRRPVTERSIRLDGCPRQQPEIDRRGVPARVFSAS